MVYSILLVEYRSIQSISFVYTFAFTFMVFLFKINAVGQPKPIIFHKLPLSGAKCLEMP